MTEWSDRELLERAEQLRTRRLTELGGEHDALVIGRMLWRLQELLAPFDGRYLRFLIGPTDPPPVQSCTSAADTPSAAVGRENG